MCGISGIASLALSPERMLEAVRVMGRYLHHRGPDAWGEWTSAGVVLGHNRLSILDLEGGVQPMACVSGEHVIVFNGEIYNFRELRASIVAAGGMLKTDHSDTEAIVEGFRLWGETVFARLDGMFACAIWSRATRRLVLARDRVGIKPMYYCRVGEDGLAFASEPKALIGSRVIEPVFDRTRLAEYFLFRAPLQPATLFAGVHALEPGTLLEFDARDGTLARRRFADCVPEAAGTGRSAGETEIREVLDGAVKSHLVADVEVGVFLSGGVDSSIVAALAARQQGIRAFNISTGGPLDEFEFAQQVAGHVGAEMHSRRVTPDDMIGRLDDWSYFNDDPVADPSALALMLLAGDVQAQGLKVMLSGEGADELFGGYRAYSRFLAARALTDRIGSLPDWANRTSDAPTREYLGDAAAPFWGTAHVTTAGMRRQLLGADPHELRERAEGESRSHGHLRNALRVDQRLRLPADILMRTDRATMACSVEARVPMLDNAVLAASWRVADRDLCRLVPPANKPLLKSLAAGLVPRRVVYRRKVGFDLPLDRWLARDFEPRITAMIRERSVPGIDYSTIAQWHGALRNGAARLAGVLWAWFVLELWYRRWIERVSPPRAQASSPRTT